MQIPRSLEPLDRSQTDQANLEDASLSNQLDTKVLSSEGNDQALDQLDHDAPRINGSSNERRPDGFVNAGQSGISLRSGH